MKEEETVAKSSGESPIKYGCRYCGDKFELKRADSQIDICYRHACRNRWYNEKRKKARLDLGLVPELKRKKVQVVAERFFADSVGSHSQIASPEEVLRMLEKGVVLKVIALLKKEFDV